MKTTSGTDLDHAVTILNNGELVAIPTETVYGLAGNALDANVVLKIFKTKDRPEFDPLIVHVSGIDEVVKYASYIPGTATKLMQKFWPGPLTILLKKKNIIPDLVTSGLDTVALRVPNHPTALKLLQQLNFPLAAPSANPFGYISPTSAKHVADQLSGKISYILDGGNCQVGIESTIVGFENETVIIYRLGGTSVDAIREEVKDVIILDHATANPKAPGMLKSHYAPLKPLYFGALDKLIQTHHQSNGAIICFTGKTLSNKFNTFEIIRLSPEGNLDEAARNLFSALRTLDRTGIDFILAEKFPDEGLGKAINDRLLRASFRE